MAEAYKSSFNEAYNHPLQVAGRIREQKLKENLVAPTIEFKTDYVVEKFVSILINDGKGNSYEKKYFENDKDFENRQKFYYLTSEFNDPNSPGHNPTTKVGVELKIIKRQK